jgi:c-di-GMP-binding flagellar brake protein YcgR
MRRYAYYDRRRFQRLRVNLSVFYKVESPEYVRSLTQDMEIEATTLDISKGGMSFLTKYAIPAWSMLSIKVYLFKTDNEGIVSFSDPVEISAEVRSSISVADGEYRLGVCFKDSAIKDRAGISDFIASSL